MALLEEIREKQRARGPATILAIGTATPSHCIYQSDFTDYYFRVTKSDHMPQLKAKLKRICKINVILYKFMHHLILIMISCHCVCMFNFCLFFFFFFFLFFFCFNFFKPMFFLSFKKLKKVIFYLDGRIQFFMHKLIFLTFSRLHKTVGLKMWRMKGTII